MTVEKSGFSKWLVALFATPLGIFVLAAFDSTMFFFFPLGIDAVVIIVSARMSSRTWMIPILATAGSFGTITDTRVPPRIVQLGLKLNF